MEKSKLKASARRSTSCEKTPKSLTEDPTPLELDRFVPWKFMQLQSVQNVVVTKIFQEENSPRRRFIRNSGRNSQGSASSQASDAYVAPLKPGAPNKVSMSITENDIPVTMYYNRAGQVTEIAIRDYSFPINSKLFEIISVCLPFHKLLYKITCKGKGLDYSIINEIAKVLPLSNLTDVCLDNTFVPQGNYYILLDQASTLKCLSLSKCKINDTVCQKIAERLECSGPASKYLRVLCLSCNLITDTGAKSLGKSLRTNRHLQNLNVCGNSITSVGAGYLLESLSEFHLTTEEIREKIRIRREYLRENTAVIPVLKSPTQSTTELYSKNEKDKNLKMVRCSIVSQSQTHVNCSELDEKLLEDYAFSPSNTFYRDGCWFAVGNLALCSLNLAYNNLDYTSLLKIIDVLSYQKDQERDPRRTGLLRIVIAGNYLPVNCEDYSKVESLLAILNNGARSFRKQSSKKSFELRKKRRNMQDTNSFSSPSVVDSITVSTDAAKNQAR